MDNYNRYIDELTDRVNPQRRKFTAAQHRENWLRQQKGEVVPELERKATPGICEQCGGGKFRQYINTERQLVRQCKTERCAHECIV